MAKIFIDAGHGGNDPGAVGNGLREKDLTLDISKRIKRYLDGNYSGHITRLSRTNDTSLTLKQRTDAANKWGADYLLSVHINAGGGTGYEDFVYNGKTSKASISHRDTIHGEVVKALGKGVRNRGKKTANFHMLRESNMPAMLGEVMFIDTAADAKKLKDGDFLQTVAEGYAKGLVKAFNLARKGSGKPATNVKPKPTKPSNKPSSNGSIVDYLKSQGKDSSFAARRKLAQKHGIKGYVGTGAQNVRLLNALKGGGAKPKSSSTKPKASAKLQAPNATLRRGSRGDNVRQLQRALNSVYFKVGAVDGIYGSKTEDAVRRFQKVHDPYRVDGIYGARTRKRLNALLK